MKLTLKIVVIVVVLAVQGLLAYFIMDWMATSTPVLFPTTEEAASDPYESSVRGYEYGSIFMLHDLVVNPRASKGRRIFKISLALEYNPENTELAEEMKDKSPFMRDHLIQYLGAMDEMTLADISFREEMRDSLHVSLNRFLRKGQVDRVLFQDFIRQ